LLYLIKRDEIDISIFDRTNHAQYLEYPGFKELKIDIAASLSSWRPI